ncbi:MAG TPA: hypothetical protein VFD27_10095 [Chthoniobacteraceae bacterium]|nr:hypothetical protein [Chthoniobacteraceae bacterium]
MSAPLPRTNFRPTKWTLALVIVVLWSVLLYRCHAATVVAGVTQSGNDRPFGFQKGVTAAYPGEYQQIYRKGLFQPRPGLRRSPLRNTKALGMPTWHTH